MTNAIKATSQIVDLCTQRIGALRKHVQPNTVIVINGQTLKLDDVIAYFQADLDFITLVATKRGELKLALTGKTGADLKRRSLDKGLKAWVANQFGSDSQAEHDFGYPPMKKATKTSGTVFLATVKNKATRVARHTMSKKAKAAIKGAITEPVIVPLPPAPVVVNVPPHVPTATAQPAVSSGTAQPPVSNGTAAHVATSSATP